MADPANADVPAVDESTMIGKIAAAMLEADNVTKDRENKEQGYKFASAEQILAAVREPLLRRGIVLLAGAVEHDETEIQSRSGTKGTRVVITYDFAFYAGDGTPILSRRWKGEGQDYGDKAYGKAATNAVKTFIRTGWLMPTEHDDPEGSDPGERRGEALPPFAMPASAKLIQPTMAAVAGIIGQPRTLELIAAVREKCGGDLTTGIVFALGTFANLALLEIPPDTIKTLAAARAEAEAAAAAEATAETGAAPAAPETPAAESGGDEK